VFVFFDEAMSELARFIERTPVSGEGLERHFKDLLKF
jgi:hypothetical protein